MAYMNQEKKKEIAAMLKEKLKGYPIKYSLSVKNHSTIVCTISSGEIDFGQDEPDFHYQVNNYYIKSHFTGKAAEVLSIINECLNLRNFDHSDPMTDYFHVGHYVDIQIGRWDKKYQYIGKKAA